MLVWDRIFLLLLRAYLITVIFQQLFHAINKCFLSAIPLEGTLGCQWQALAVCMGKGLQADQVGRLGIHNLEIVIGMGSRNVLVVIEQDESYAAKS